MKRNRMYMIAGIVFILLISTYVYSSIANTNEGNDKQYVEGGADQISLDIDLGDGDSVEDVKNALSKSVEGNLIEKADNLDLSVEVSKQNISREIFDIEMKEIGRINPERIAVTPGEDSTKSIGITFNLDYIDDNALVIVLDEEYGILGEYASDITEFQVIIGGIEVPLYSYKCEINEIEGNDIFYLIKSRDQFSKIYSVSLPKENEPTVIAFFGDTQGYLQSQYDDFRITYEKAVEVSDVIDMFYIAGDIVDTGSSWDQWTYFDNSMKDILEREIFVTTIGNHDVINGGDIYVNTFNYPENGVEGLLERTYYYDIPSARIAVWDTEKPSMFTQQSDWLKGIMEASDAAYKIVFMHRSCYPAAYNEEYIRNLTAVFEEAGIDLVLSGHDHIYSSTTMRNGVKVPVGEGITYIVGGSSTGSKYYGLIDETDRYWLEKLYDDNNPVFTLVTVGEEQINITAYAIINGENVVIDELIIE